MDHSTFVKILAIFLISLGFIFTLGFSITKLLEKILSPNLDKEVNLSSKIGLSLLLGIGLVGYTGLIIGLLGIFNASSLLSFWVLLEIIIWRFIIKRKTFTSKSQSLTLPRQKNNLREYIWSQKKDFFSYILIFITIIILIGIYFSALLPPHAPDELSYHLPEANIIVQSQKILPTVGGHFFYGNIPKLMEIVQAYGIVFQGYELAHLLNFIILIGLLMTIFGIIKQNFGLAGASLSILFIILFDEFTNNIVSGYVDASTASFEVASILCLTHSYITKQRFFFFISALLLGIALSIKYSALFTLLFSILLICYFLIGRHNLFITKKDGLVWSILVVLICGYWYFKNLFLFSNPFYPLYFGHSGVTDEEYISLIAAVQQFKDRSLVSFLSLPISYFNISTITIFISFLLSPFSVFKNKFCSLNLILLTFSICYFGYWFFFASSQTRFVFPPVILITILATIVVANLKPAKLLVTILGLVTIIILFHLTIHPLQTNNFIREWYQEKFHVFARQYALGKITNEEYLRSWFGCQYNIVLYLQKNKLPGNVVDNWTVWHDKDVPFYSPKNIFQSLNLPVSASSTLIDSKIKEDNIQYVYFNADTKERFSNEVENIMKEYYHQRINIENYLLDHSVLIYKDDPCKLYRLEISYTFKTESIASMQPLTVSSG